VTRFGSMVRGVVEEAEDKLWKDLMWATQEQRFEVPLDKLQDDVTWTKRGVSFVDNANNGLQDKREWMIKRALADARGKRHGRLFPQSLTNMRARVQLDSRLALTVLSKARPRTASIRQDSTGWTRPVCPRVLRVVAT
jgi:hypothetical protein